MSTTTRTSTQRTRPSSARRRAMQESVTGKVPAEVPAVEIPTKTQRRAERRGMGRMSRRALAPFMELYFVGIGAADWALEQAIIVERKLAERGHRRNEKLGRAAAEVGEKVMVKTRAMSERGREKMGQLGEKAGEGMGRMRMRREMSEAEPA